MERRYEKGTKGDVDLKRPLLGTQSYQQIPETGFSTSFPKYTSESDVTKRLERNGNDVIPSSNSAVSYSATRARVISTLVVFLYAMGSYPSDSVLQQYLVHRWSSEANISGEGSVSVCFRNSSDPRQREEDAVQARVSSTTSYYSYAVNVPALVYSVLMGTYSDVIGRRKTLIVPLTFTLARFIITVFIIGYDLNTDLFYLAKVVDGVGGSFFVVLIATYSISSDLSSRKSGRLLWMNVITCLNQAATAGFVILSGHMIDSFGFEAAAILNVVPVAMSFFIALIFLPETRPLATGSRLDFLNSLKRIVHLYTSTKRRRICLLICLVLFFLSLINILNSDSMDTLYQMHRPLCWDSTHISYYSGFKAGMSLVGVLYHSIAQRIGCVSDELLAMIGLLFEMGGYLLESFATSELIMYRVPVVLFPSFIVTGIIRGIMSVLAGPYNQGALFASTAVVEVVCSIASNTALNQLYSATVDTYAGAVYILMASFALLAFLVFFVFFYFYEPMTGQTDLHKHDDQEEKRLEDQD